METSVDADYRRGNNMNCSYKKGKALKTLKAASPEVLFARFLQKQNQAPTHKQLSTWELDGGQYDESQDDFVIIGGQKCHNLYERTRARMMKYWRMTRMYFHVNQSQLSK